METRRTISQATFNAVKCSHYPAESPDHRMTKYFMAEFCYQHGLHFATEATFTGNARADFVILDWGIAFEIYKSETLKDMKKKKYPIPIIPVKAACRVTEIMPMLEDLQTTDGGGYDYYLNKK